MSRPVVGILGNGFLINDQYPAHAVGSSSARAVADVAGAMPMLIPADPELVDIAQLLETCDGFVLPGGRANVHPEEYGEEPTEAHGLFDRGRDRVALALVRACLERGQPIFGICRGFQEINVALGGTLWPEIRELPGRMNHRMPPDGTLEEKFALRHTVSLAPDSGFARLMGSTQILTNTLHGQGIKTCGRGVVVEGWAPDGTPEAIRVPDAPGFTYSVQWHPEWNAGGDPASHRLFSEFGQALRAWVDRPRMRRAS